MWYGFLYLIWFEASQSNIVLSFLKKYCLANFSMFSIVILVFVNHEGVRKNSIKMEKSRKEVDSKEFAVVSWNYRRKRST